MPFIQLSTALSVKEKTLVEKITHAQNQLEAIPDAFYALFWLYTHDYLYISNSVEEILGHPFEKFCNHGVVFLQTIIPQRFMIDIYDSLNIQALQIENNPEYLNAEKFVSVEAAVNNKEMKEVPVKYNGLLLDVRPYEPTSYLVLGSWINTTNKSETEILDTEMTIKNWLSKIKEVYLDSNTEHFKMLSLGKRISAREKQVALLLMEGQSTKTISDQLQISFNTVESHRKNLLSKLESKNTAELIHKLNSIPLKV